MPDALKVIEVTNVDFSLRHFLLPLMRAIRARGHEVVGVCAEGRCWRSRAPRGSGSMRRAVRAQRVAAGALAGVPRPGAAVPCGAAGPGARAHADQRLSGPAGGLVAGVPRVAYTVPRLLFNHPGSWPRSVAGFAMEWLAAGSPTSFLTVSEARRRTRGGCTSTAAPSRSAMAAIRRVFRPDPAARAAYPRRAWRAGRTGGGARGVAAGLAQGLSGTGRRDARGAGGGAVGRRRAADLGSRRRHGGAAAERRPGRPAAAARLSR